MKAVQFAFNFRAKKEKRSHAFRGAASCFWTSEPNGIAEGNPVGSRQDKNKALPFVCAILNLPDVCDYRSLITFTDFSRPLPVRRSRYKPLEKVAMGSVKSSSSLVCVAINLPAMSYSSAVVRKGPFAFMTM